MNADEAYQQELEHQQWLEHEKKLKADKAYNEWLDNLEKESGHINSVKTPLPCKSA